MGGSMNAAAGPLDSLFQNGFANGLIESAIYSVVLFGASTLSATILRNTVRYSGDFGRALQATLSGILRRDSQSAFDGGGLLDRTVKFLFYLIAIAPFGVLFIFLSAVGLTALVTALKADASLGQTAFFSGLDLESDPIAQNAIFGLAILLGFGLAVLLERTWDWAVHVLNMIFFLLFGALGGAVGLGIADWAGWLNSPGWALPTASGLITLLTAGMALYYAYGFVPDRWKDVIAFDSGTYEFNPITAIGFAIKNIFGILILIAVIGFIISPALN